MGAKPKNGRPTCKALALPGTPQWLALRKTGIGSSEAPAACGVSKWDTPLDVYLRKTGVTGEFSGNIHTRVGSALEPVILAEFTEATGKAVDRPVPMFRSSSHPWMLATCDALAGDTEIVECKNTGIADAWGDPGTDEIPEEVVIQCQHQMAVTGRLIVWVAVLIDGRDFRVYRVDRDADLIAWLVETIAEFWRRVQDEDPPTPDFEHKNAVAAINRLHGYKVDHVAVEFSKPAARAGARLEGLRETQRDVEKEIDACKAALLAEMGAAEWGLMPDGTAFKRSYRKPVEYTVKRKESIVLAKAKLPKNLTLKATQ